MRHYGICLAALALVAVTCPAGPVESQVTREQAIEVARQEVSFQPDSVEAVLSTHSIRASGRIAPIVAVHDRPRRAAASCCMPGGAGA